jgi:hypothetical protein
MPSSQYTITLEDKLSNPMQKIAASGALAFNILTANQQAFNIAINQGEKQTSLLSLAVSKLESVAGNFQELKIEDTMSRWTSNLNKAKTSFQSLTRSVKSGNSIFGRQKKTPGNSNDASSKAGDGGNGIFKQNKTSGDKNSPLKDKLQSGLSKLSQTNSDEIATTVNDKMTAGIDQLISKFPILQSFKSDMINGLGSITGWIQENSTTIDSLIFAVGTAYSIYNGWMLLMEAKKAIMVAYNTITTVITSLTKGWSFAQIALNSAMEANPIGLIIVGVLALVAAIIYAWNKFAGFRGVIMGVWEVMKGFGEIIKTYIVERVKGLISGIGSIATAFKELFSGNWSAAWDATKEGIKGIAGTEAKKNAIEAGKKLGENFNNGFEKGQSEDSKINFSLDKLMPKPGALSGNKSNTGDADTIANTGDSEGLVGSTQAKSGITGITGGGSRNTNINISLGNLIETFNIKSETIEEGIDHMREIVTEQLLRVLNSSNKLSTQQ